MGLKYLGICSDLNSSGSGVLRREYLLIDLFQPFSTVRSGQVLGANRLCKPSTSVHLPPDNLVVGGPEQRGVTLAKNVYIDRILVQTFKHFMPIMVFRNDHWWLIRE